MIRVGYLGPEATFTNMAVSRFPEAEHVPYRTMGVWMQLQMEM